MPRVSIIVPTCNQLSLLRRCIQNVRTNVTLPHELIVVDAGSHDGTTQFLARHTGLRVIRETVPHGAAATRKRSRGINMIDHQRHHSSGLDSSRADHSIHSRATPNPGLRAARGRYVMWLENGAYPLRGSAEAAILELKRSEAAGMVAFYDDGREDVPVHDVVRRDGIEYRIYDMRGYIFARHGLMPRSVMLALLNSQRSVDINDPHPSLQVQLDLGLPVITCPCALVHRPKVAPIAGPDTPSRINIGAHTPFTTTRMIEHTLPEHSPERLQPV